MYVLIFTDVEDLNMTEAYVDKFRLKWKLIECEANHVFWNQEFL